MDRIYLSGAAGSAPTIPGSPSAGYPTNGNPGVTPATVPGAWWYHMITEELYQLILDAGLTPAGATLTQLRDAVRLLSSPAGIVAAFAANAAPGGWLKANGAAVSRTTYAKLFTAIGTTFGSGDGSTTFNLPDLRGEFVRGWDDSRGVDSGRAFGTAQSGAIQSHTHDGETSTRGGGASDALIKVGTGGTSQAGVVASTGGAETRPRNIALLFCIKY